MAWLRTDPGRLWIASEILFTVAYFGWALMRSFSPEILGTEKPMDMAMVNAAGRSPGLPPHDPWLSGTSLNYYYFGHHLVASMIRATGVRPEVGYNLAVALFFGLCATAMFALGVTLLKVLRPDAGRRTLVWVGLVSSSFGVGLGNLAGALQFQSGHFSVAGYDWWSPSRVIDHTINEFPNFSFLLGDLHAHVMVVPFALIGIAFALQLALGGPRLFPRSIRGRREVMSSVGELLLFGVVTGSLLAMNTLNLPTGVLVTALALAIWAGRDRTRVRPAVVWGVIAAAVSILLYLPFILRYAPDADGIGVVAPQDSMVRFVLDSFLIYGLFFWIIGATVVRRFRRIATERGDLAGLVFSFSVLLVATVFVRRPGLILLAVVACALHAGFDKRLSDATRFLWVLIAVAVGLVTVGEIVHIKDAFAGTPEYRMNTVFKLGYQAWWLLAVAAACALFLRSSERSRVSRIWAVGTAVLLVLSVVYPVVAPFGRTGGFRIHPTLDGLAWLQESAPADLAAIRWLRANAEGSPVVLETVAGEYDPEGRGRVSTFTGLPSVLTSPGHELQWGHDSGERLADVAKIYETRDQALARTLLARYGVGYIFVGSLERADHGGPGLEKFSDLGTEVFKEGRTAIYQVGS
jgi:YYY domain-containing protein